MRSRSSSSPPCSTASTAGWRARCKRAVEVRRRARQPRRLRQLRRRAGRDRLHLGTRRPAARLRLDRRHGVCDRHRPAARPLQHDDRRREAQVAGRVLHGHAGARRAPSRCCCRSISTGSASSTCAPGPGSIAVYTMAMAGCWCRPSRPSPASSWASASPASTCCRLSSASPRSWPCSLTYPYGTLTLVTLLYLCRDPD